MAALAFFIEWPWLAFIPAIVFFVLYQLSGRRGAAIVASAWLLYALYEYAMRFRWLCSGECNIRVDLLLLHPVLAFTSIVCAAIILVGLLRQGRES